MCSVTSHPVSLRLCWANWKRLISLQRLLTSGQSSSWPSCGVRWCHSSDASQPDRTVAERRAGESDAHDLGNDESVSGVAETTSSVAEASNLPNIRARLQVGQNESTERTRESSSSNGTSSGLSAGASSMSHSCTSIDQADARQEQRKRKEAPVPPDPETCCESGCVNCVWIKYAEEVKEYYPDHKERLKEIVDKIEDYNVKMFVKLELGVK